MTHADAECLQLLVVDRIARISLNRPERRNAINESMHARFREVLDVIEADEQIRVVLITGAGEAFCAGQDLSERASGLQSGGVDLEASLRDNYNPFIRRLLDLRCPIVAAVNGIAAGAGAGLAFASDIVLASPSASFQLAFARVGLAPDCGISWLLPRLVGPCRALGMALTADPIDAPTAERWGLVWQVVPHEQLAAAAEAMARRLAGAPRAALQGIKRRLRDAATETLEEALKAESILQGQLGHTSDYQEAVTAFMSKRTPRFD